MFRTVQPGASDSRPVSPVLKNEHTTLGKHLPLMSIPDPETEGTAKANGGASLQNQHVERLRPAWAT